jgi:hypothetical protein
MNTLLQQWGKSMLTMGNIYFLLLLTISPLPSPFEFPNYPTVDQNDGTVKSERRDRAGRI